MKIQILLTFILCLLCLNEVGAQDLFVSDIGTSIIYEFSPDGTQSVFATGVSNLWDLTFDHAGNLYAADYGANSIYQFASNGVKSVFANVTLFNSTAHGLVFDRAGNLFVTPVPGAYIYKINPDGSGSTFGPAMTAPGAMVFDLTGNLFVTAIQWVNPGRGGTPYPQNVLYKFTPDATQTIVATNNVPISNGGALDATGNLFFSSTPDGYIYKYAPDGTPSLFASGLNRPCGLAFDGDGNLYVADQGSGNIYKFAPDGTRSTFAAGLNAPTGLAFAAGVTPSLSIQLTATNTVQISWPAAAGNSWTLCRQPGLGAIGNWTTLTNNPPTLAGANYVVTEPCTSTACFYRLEKQ